MPNRNEVLQSVDFIKTWKEVLPLLKTEARSLTEKPPMSQSFEAQERI